MAITYNMNVLQSLAAVATFLRADPDQLGRGQTEEAAPVIAPQNLEAEARDNPVGVITGILDILRHGEGNEAARNWASGCVFSGECIKACDYGVNPLGGCLPLLIQMPFLWAYYSMLRDALDLAPGQGVAGD